MGEVMHNVIHKLAEQAEEYAAKNSTRYWEIGPDYQDLFDKMFAELIVAETIAVLQKRFTGDLNREDMEVRRCIADVQKHFGVEE
jgi:hypothetical protein